MMQVFLEIEFRRIARLEQLAEGEDGKYDKEKADIRATQRYCDFLDFSQTSKFEFHMKRFRTGLKKQWLF